jgi:hypothetical protein
MAKESAIRGQKALALPRASKREARGRVCAQEGCETQLSTYNRRERCWAHAEMKVPRLRGRKPAAGSA